jgi:hypothetical protein
LSDETTDFGYFSIEEMDELEMLLNHKERIVELHPKRWTGNKKSLVS